MTTRTRAAILLLLLASALGVRPVLAADPAPRATHPASVLVNGRSYRWPQRPVVVVLIDGNDPEYVKAGIERGILPNMKRFIEEGFGGVALGAMPSFTNPNNLSVITGVPPSGHGISGNYFLDPATGREVMMNEPSLVRVPTILSAFSQAGAKVVALTAKDKLARMLAAGLDPGHGDITFSSERADACTRARNGIDDCLAYVGRPLPDPYSGELSLFVLEAGALILEREKPDLMYLSTSDFMQHTFAPGSPEANAFYASLDRLLGRLAATGAIVAVTADHGMNDKSRADGSPNVLFLQDVLDGALGEGSTRVLLPITDPYVRHHGALGSYATVFLHGSASPAQVAGILRGLQGIEVVLDRDAAARVYELPPDRIGDLVVVSDRGTVIGTRARDHDLTKLAGHRLRSHGGLAERNTYLMVSRPLDEEYEMLAVSRPLHNYDVFDFALNGLR